MLCATGANATVNFTSAITRTAVQDTLKFEKTALTGDDGTAQYQEIYTSHTISPLISYSTRTLRGQFAITASDLEGKLPKGAKLTGFSVDGYNNGGKCTTFSIMGLWIDAYDTIPELNYQYGYENWTAPTNKVSDEFEYTFSSSSTKDANVSVFNIPFVSSSPYTYAGNDLLLTMQMEYTGNNAMDYYYKKATANTKIATVYRDKNYAFSANGVYDNGSRQSYISNHSGINIDGNTIPAFKLSYFTNDIRVTVRSADGNTMAAYLTLWDKTTGEMLYNNVKASDYTFSNLDYTHEYTLKAYNRYSDAIFVEDIDFGDNAINNDVEISLVNHAYTGVEDVINNAAEVASVKYVNLQGVESAEPFSGVNVVVTTYTDGTSTAVKKLIK